MPAARRPQLHRRGSPGTPSRPWTLQKRDRSLATTSLLFGFLRRVGFIRLHGLGGIESHLVRLANFIPRAGRDGQLDNGEVGPWGVFIGAIPLFNHTRQPLHPVDAR